MLRLSLQSVFSLLLLVDIAPALAQDVPLSIDFPLDGITYDESIPRPESVIGHVVGTRHTAPHQIVAYFRALDAASDRVEVRQHGSTYEGRPLIHAVVTSPANHGRLEDIRRANLRLSDEAAAVSDAEVATMPTIVYQGYSIHGNESSGSEAALLYLYHLAAAQGPSIEESLATTVLLVDPLFNPDGRDRFVDWVNRNRGAIHTSDGQDREHNEPWPGGRTNHYFFDMNRDWLPVQLKESQARIDLYHQWRPQVLTDHHEMGGSSTFFFQPGVPSRTNPNTSERNQELTAAIAQYHAEQLDTIGSLYFSKESYDDFYYGKGSTFPDINGAVGILFEQASSRALEADTDNGPLHYAFTIRNQFATSLSTLKAATELRTELLGYQRDFYAGATGFARNSDTKAWVFESSGSVGRARGMVDVFLRHRIRVYRLARDITASGKAFAAASSFVVPIDQPQAQLIASMMEERTTFADSIFYDISSWTMPRAFNLDFAAWTSSPRDLLGDEVQRGGVTPAGRIVGPANAYAYLIPWGEYFLPREVYRLQEAGIRVRMASRAFSMRVNTKTLNFEAGTLIVPVGQAGIAPDEVRRAVDELATATGLEVTAVTSGFAATGPDLGTGSAEVLEQPRIALLSGSGASSAVVGEVWHLLGEQFAIPVSLLDNDRVDNADLSRYNVMIMTGGSPDVDAIQSWVRGGGTLIAIGGGVTWAVSNDLADLERRPYDIDSLVSGVSFADASNARSAWSLGGAIFGTSVDTTHPLAYGFGEELAVFRRGTTFFDAPESARTRVATYTATPLISGYAKPLHLEKAAGAMAVAAFSSGQGRVVTFADDPIFRAFWWGPASMLLNAIFLPGVY